jgi:hypothetical protein
LWRGAAGDSGDGTTGAWAEYPSRPRIAAEGSVGVDVEMDDERVGRVGSTATGLLVERE